MNHSRRPPSDSRKFGSIRVLRDGRVRFSAWTVPGLPQLAFVAHHRSLGLDDVPVHDLASYNVSAELRGGPIFFLHITRHRVESAGFPYVLSPDALREAISVLRAAGNGLERWIIPALEHNQGSAVMKRNYAETYRIIPELLESCRKLPVAEQWKRARRKIQRDWAKQLREKPDIEVPAPWMLRQRKKSR